MKQRGSTRDARRRAAAPATVEGSAKVRRKPAAAARVRDLEAAFFASEPTWEAPADPIDVDPVPPKLTAQARARRAYLTRYVAAAVAASLALCSLALLRGRAGDTETASPATVDPGADRTAAQVAPPAPPADGARPWSRSARDPQPTLGAGVSNASARHQRGPRPGRGRWSAPSSPAAEPTHHPPVSKKPAPMSVVLPMVPASMSN